MSALRVTLVALLIGSTALFVAGAIAERSAADRSEPPVTHSHAESEATHRESTVERGGDEDETLLGVDLESIPMIVLAVFAGLGLAALAAARLRQTPAALLAIALIALAWAVLDVREVAHQLDESNTGIAIAAAVVGLLHLTAAAIAGRLATRTIGTRARPGTRGFSGLEP